MGIASGKIIPAEVGTEVIAATVEMGIASGRIIPAKVGMAKNFKNIVTNLFTAEELLTLKGLLTDTNLINAALGKNPDV